MYSMEEKEQWRARIKATTEALQQIEPRGLKTLTNEEAQAIINSLCACEPPWFERPEWSGLVVQQAIFRRGYKK